MRHYHLFIFLSLAVCFANISLYAQVKIGDNPKNINPHVLLELESKDQGVLFPRLTQAQRDVAFGVDIPDGLIIFNTDKGGLEVYSIKKGWETLGVLQIPPSTLELTADHQLIMNGELRVNLTNYFNVNQQLTLVGNILSLTNGGRVDLSSLTISSTSFNNSSNNDLDKNNLEGQTLSFTKLGTLNQTTLKLEGGNEITLTAGDGIQFHTTSNSLMISGSNQMGVFSSQNNVTSNSQGNIDTDDFVFGSDQLDNKTGGDDDTRMLFDKSKGAFRAGRDGRGSWNESKRGEFSVGLGYNTEAKADRSVALGNGLTANAYAETLLGSYNDTFPGANLDSWEDQDPLLTFGNGTSSSKKSTALTLLKNGNLGIGTMTPKETLEVAGTISATTIGGNTFVLKEGGTIIPNKAGLYASVSNALTELIAFDSAGNESTISPHNFSLIGKPSEEMAWSYYSRNNLKNKQLNVDMMKMSRLVERMSGQKLVYIADLEGNILQQNPKSEVTQFEKEISMLKAENQAIKNTLEVLLKKIATLENH
ncbi:MAG: hypothetical protein VW127_09060 [Flavobacteriaceae bacterium]|jgi:hypothetical protein